MRNQRKQQKGDGVASAGQAAMFYFADQLDGVKGLRRYELSYTYEVVTVNGRGDLVRWEKRRTLVSQEQVRSMVMDLVPIPGGHFRIGTPASDRDRSATKSLQYEVSLPGLWMGQYPVTQAQYKVAMGKKSSQFKWENCPVEQMSWYEEQMLCDRLCAQTGRQYQLPSEAEWEYTCQEGKTTPFLYGETLNSELANYWGNRIYQVDFPGRNRGETTEIGQFPPNGYGLYNMHRAVFERCLDSWHCNYRGALTDGNAWETVGSRWRLVRGGSWLSTSRNCPSAYRNFYEPSGPPKKLCLVSVAREARHTNQAKFFNQAKSAWRTTSNNNYFIGFRSACSVPGYFSNPLPSKITVAALLKRVRFKCCVKSHALHRSQHNIVLFQRIALCTTERFPKISWR
jgi:formylglycine-generating enzyme required for sulfatase activity